MSDQNLPAIPDEPGALPSRDQDAYYDVEAYDDSGKGLKPVDRLRRYAAGVWRHKWLVVLTTLLGAGAAAYVYSAMEPEYQAEATIWIEVDQRNQGNSGPLQQGRLLTDYAWVDLLRSFVVLDYVVREERLYLQPRNESDLPLFDSFTLADRFRPGEYRLSVDPSGRRFQLSTGEGITIEEGDLGAPVGVDLGFDWTPDPSALPSDRPVRFTVLQPRDASRTLLSQLQSRMQPNRNFMRLELRGTDPERLASVMNTLANRFVDVAAELKRAKLDELTEILHEQLSHSLQNVQGTEMQLEDFRVATVTLPSERRISMAPGLEMTRTPVYGEYFSLTAERDQLRRDREAIEQILARRNREGISPNALQIIPAVQGSVELPKVLDELATKQAEARALSRGYTEDHPAVIRVTGEIRELETATIPAVAGRLVRDLADREAKLATHVAAASSELREIPTRAIEETRLERELEIAGTLYTTLQQRYEAARLAAESSVPDVRILDEATAPTSPVNDQRRMFAAMALLFGVLAGVGGGVGLDLIDRKVRYPDQVTNDMGLPILGIVPDIRRAGRRKHDEVTRQAVEALREIRLNLWHTAGGQRPLVVALTSPGSGEGKSFVSTNLALAFADAGHPTLLIDGDVRRGTQDVLLDADRSPGLTDFLMGRAVPGEIIQKVSGGRFDLISRGTLHRQGPELLGSLRMRQLVELLRPRYSVILIDSPPMGAGVDPFTLGTIAGNIMLVVRVGTTDRELAAAKMRLTDRLPVSVLGAVMNGVSFTRFAGYYYQPYLEGYGVEEADELEEASGRAPQLSGA